jgi:ABC-2 type transport system permease protein
MIERFFILWRKELAGYFLSPIAYATMAFFLVVMGTVFYFLVGLLTTGVPGVNVLNLMFGSPFYWMTQMVVIPLLTMRLFAEERRMGTLETLLTAPVSDLQVVLAKFAGVLSFYCIMWIPTVLFFVGLRWFSSDAPPVEPGMLAAAYVGVALGGCMFLSIGLLCSLITANQIIAAMTCFMMLVAVFFTGFIEFVLPANAAPVFADLASPHRHLLEFSRGMIDTRSVVFYLSGMVFFLFTATRILEARRWR